MKKRNLIFGGVAGLVFMVFTAVNLTVSQSYQNDGTMAQLSLAELAAVAQTGSEKKCNSIEDCPADMISLSKDGKVYCCNQSDPVDTGHWDDVPTLK